MSAVARSPTQAFRQLYPSVSGPAKTAVPRGGFFENIANAFKSGITKAAKPSTSTKALVGAGFATSSLGLLTLTPGGQQLQENVGQTGTNIASFIQNNSLLIAAGLLILGLVVIKK